MHYPIVSEALCSAVAMHRGHAWLLQDPNETADQLEAATGRKGCAYCGGLGHRVTDCPKLRADTQAAKRKRMGGVD